MERGAVLVDGRVGQVGVDIADLGHVGRVLLGGEADQAFLVQVALEGEEGRHKHVEAEVELEPADQEGVPYVFLNHVLLVVDQLSKV